LGISLPVTPGDAHVALAVLAIALVPVAAELFFRGWLLRCI